MRFGILLRALGVAALAGSLVSPASSQPRSMAGRWQVDWGDRRCSLIRHPVGDEPMLAVITTPGTRLWQLVLVRSSWPRELRGERPPLVVRLSPGESAVEGSVAGGRTTLGATITVSRLRNEFVERFADSRAVSIGTSEQPLYDIPLVSARAAIAGLRECETSALREWGIDPVAFAAVSVPASGDVAQFVFNSDYPSDALSREESGTSVVRITVEENGRVSECAPVAGSRIESLDNATCRVLLRRARLSPARDAQGNAIRSQLVTTITWRIFGS